MIQKVINEDPTLTDATKISVEVASAGPFWNRQTVVRIVGKTANERERSKVEAVVRNHAPEAQIENALHATVA